MLDTLQHPNTNTNNPALLLLLSRLLLLLCALLAFRAPVAHPPILRTPHSQLLPHSHSHIIILTSNTTKLIEISGSNRRPMSKARVYADINVVRPKEYWDYESLTVQWGYLNLFS